MPPKRKNSASTSTSTSSGSLRRSSRLSATTAAPRPADPEPKKKKAKTAKTESDEGSSVPKQTGTKRGKKGSSKAANVPENTRTIIVERCTQCSSFKTRANQVKEGLEDKIAGINVVVNPEKPRKGCFEIREENGEVFLSLLGMKRPFTEMKALDMEEEVSKIVAQIQGD